MPRRPKGILASIALLFVLGTVPAISQQCKLEDGQDAAMAAFSEKVAGTGTTWIDVFSRIIAQVDSLDLESGDTSTVLTWNLDEHLTVKASVVNAPVILPALKEAVGDDADLLSLLSDQVGQGDDWQVSIDYNFQNENANLGTRAVARKVATKLKSWGVAEGGVHGGQVARMDRDWGTEVSEVLGGQSCPETTLFFQGAMPVIAMEAAEVKPKTLVLNAFFRSKDDLVGQDEMGASLKFTYGFKDGKAGAAQKSAAQKVELRKAAMLVGASNVAGFSDQMVEAKFGKQVVEAKQKVEAKREAKAKEQRELARGIHAAEANLANLEVELADADAELAKAELQLAEGRVNLRESTVEAVNLIKQAQKDLPAVLDQRLSVEAQWKQLDEYSFSAQLPTPLSIPENESITATLAWSLQLKRDGKDQLNLPRFELSASYEDVDGDSARQSRLIAKLIASQKLSFMGENTEFTAGLVYANKPEYLADQEFDEQISANLGLTFKVGKVGKVN